MISRRAALSALLASPGVALAADAQSDMPPRTGPLGPADFAITGTYLNAAYTHPMTRAAAAAAASFLAGRADPGRTPDLARDAKALFARGFRSPIFALGSSPPKVSSSRFWSAKSPVKANGYSLRSCRR